MLIKICRKRDLGCIWDLTQMFRENERKNSSRVWIKESWKELWWQTVKLSYRAGDGPSIYILWLAGILIISGPILQLPELTANVNGLQCEKNVSEKWMALALKADGVDPALTTASILEIWPRLSWPNLQQYFCYYYCQADERWSEQFGISEQFYYYCQNWIWPRFDLWGPRYRNVNRAGMEMKWSWNGVEPH